MRFTGLRFDYVLTVPFGAPASQESKTATTRLDARISSTTANDTLLDAGAAARKQGIQTSGAIIILLS